MYKTFNITVLIDEDGTASFCPNDPDGSVFIPAPENLTDTLREAFDLGLQFAK